MVRRTLIVIAAALSCAASLPAQSWRSIESARQLHDTASRTVRLRYAAGKLDIQQAPAPLLYSMEMRYDAERTEPLNEYDAATRTLRVGVRDRPASFGHDREGGSMRLALTRAVTLALDMKLGAVEADLNLTGLALTSLQLQSGASDARIRFDSLNPVRMRGLRMKIGAAHVRASKLANANAEEIQVEIGVGSVELDFAGQWNSDIRLDLQLALGGASIRVPSEVGIRVEMDQFLASFQHDGLEKRGDAFYSSNWDTARHRLRIHTRTAFGTIEVERTGG